jgi:hypothetical protein
MFSQTWKKYLQVIAILLKRSSAGPQTLSMNTTDFERAAAGRKIKYSFSHLHLTNGRINIEVKHSPLARELATMLQEDDAMKKLMAGQSFEFSMSNDFVLTIKNNTVVEEADIDQTTSDVGAESMAAEQ